MSLNVLKINKASLSLPSPPYFHRRKKLSEFIRTNNSRTDGRTHGQTDGRTDRQTRLLGSVVEGKKNSELSQNEKEKKKKKEERRSLDRVEPKKNELSDREEASSKSSVVPKNKRVRNKKLI